MNLFEALDAILHALGGAHITKPVIIPGLTLGGAYAANDAFGTLFWFDVPKRGVIHAAFFYDKDNEKLGKELVLKPSEFTATANDSAFAPPDDELPGMISIPIAVGDFGSGYNANAIGQVSGLAIPYEAPLGKLWCQVVTRGADNIASGSEPSVALAIL